MKKVFQFMVLVLVPGLVLAGAHASFKKNVRFPDVSTGACPDRTVGVFVNTPASFSGYTLFAPQRYTSTYLLDNNGNLGVWMMNGTEETVWHYISNHGDWEVR